MKIYQFQCWKTGEKLPIPATCLRFAYELARESMPCPVYVGEGEQP